jgi:hypothetical protein
MTSSSPFENWPKLVSFALKNVHRKISGTRSLKASLTETRWKPSYGKEISHYQTLLPSAVDKKPRGGNVQRSLGACLTHLSVSRRFTPTLYVHESVQAVEQISIQVEGSNVPLMV